MKLFHALLMLVGLFSATVSTAEVGQPVGRITLIVTSAPGGVSDAVARVVAEGLNKKANLTVVVDNKPGNGGEVAASITARSAPTGNTLFLGSVGPLAMSTVLNKDKIDYSVQSFSAVAMVGITPSVIYSSDPSIKDWPELYKQYANDPQSNIIGYSLATGQMIIDQIKGQTKKQNPSLLFKGSGPLQIALLNGSIQSGVDVLYPMANQGPEGKIRPLVVFSEKRSPFFPNIPSITEFLPKFECCVPVFFSIVVPANTSKETIEFLNKRINEVLADPNYVSILHKQYLETHQMTPSETTSFINKAVDRVNSIAKTIQ